MLIALLDQQAPKIALFSHADNNNNNNNILKQRLSGSSQSIFMQEIFSYFLRCKRKNLIIIVP